MKLIIINIFFFIALNTISLVNLIKISSTYYYEEKYFRILSNNYEDIIQGEFWKYDEETNGLGFIANKDYGSLILLKDWSMYNFKLTKVIFKKNCQFEDIPCNAEMWLIHTKDNSYYPPGKRIYIKQNYFIIIVPFLKTDDNNPAIDNILYFLNLHEITFNEQGIISNTTTKKPVKLYKVIQNQPSILFEGTFHQKETLFLVFSQYHFISNKDFEKLFELINLKNKEDLNIIEDKNVKMLRNFKNEEDLKPKVTLMSYSKASFLNIILPFFILFLF